MIECSEKGFKSDNETVDDEKANIPQTALRRSGRLKTQQKAKQCHFGFKLHCNIYYKLDIKCISANFSIK